MHQLVKSMVNWNICNDNIMMSGVAYLKNSRSSQVHFHFLVLLLLFHTFMNYAKKSCSWREVHPRLFLANCEHPKINGHPRHVEGSLSLTGWLKAFSCLLFPPRTQKSRLDNFVRITSRKCEQISEHFRASPPKI